MKVIGKKNYKQYTLKEVLGVGSFGKVYHSPPYAIKQMCFQGMSPFLVNTLKNQIKILNKINHNNIVKLVDHFYEGHNVYLVMQFCETDLSKYLKKNRNIMNQEKAIEILKQILLGFQQLVKNEVIHRDLKPANILVTSKGQFKLADFGFAKFVNHYDSKLLYSIVGTPLYMAPQILAKKQYTTKCDIWSIGFIFYEMLTGTYPWMGVSEADLLKNITNRPLNIPEDLSQFSKRMLNRMLTINQKQRISWDELFREFLAPKKKQRSISKQVPRVNMFSGDKQNKNNKQVPRKNEKKIFTNRALNPIKMSPEKNARAKTERKQELGGNGDVDCIKCYESVFTELIEIELERLYDEQTARQICSNFTGQLKQPLKDKLKRVLEHFNPEFQKHAKKIWNLK